MSSPTWAMIVVFTSTLVALGSGFCLLTTGGALSAAAVLRRSTNIGPGRSTNWPEPLV